MKLKHILLILVFLTVLIAASLWWWARQSLPPLDGELRLAGLAAPVEVIFDGHGVPHVYAAGPEDAWFAAGALHARDRLWQMELYRRAGSGRLSEILGEETLRIDRRILTLGLRAGAEAEWQSAPPAVRAALTRYTEGVNAQMNAMSGRLRPLEFQILRFTPAPWTPLDSLVVGRLLAWRLAENHQAEIVRHALAARFGEADALRLGGSYPADAPTIVSGPRVAPPPPPETPAAPGPPPPPASPLSSVGKSEAYPVGLRWLEPSARRGNSNNWVVAGRRTASGRPLLANDPHLQIEFPGVWYELHLVAAELDVIGVTIPGAPFIIIGHNNRIAWGLTNTGADVQDLYIERVDVARSRYFSQGQWVPVDVQKIEIPIRGGEVEPFEVWRTRRGTIFADVGLDWEHAPDWLSPRTERTGERRAFALRWDAAGELSGAFEALNRARDWSTFIAAVERFAAPSQNFVYADVDGNIGYAMSGVLPQRSSGSGTFPHDGSSGGGEWVGRVSPSALPRQVNPARGFIASANNAVDRSSSAFVTHDFALPYRAMRLQDVLASAERVDVTAAAALQNDVTSLSAADILKGLEGAIAAGRKRDAGTAAMDVLSQLRTWDKRIDGRPVVTLYQLFEMTLWRRTFADEMGDDLFSSFYRWGGAERPAGIYAILNDASSRWFDDISTLERREGRDDIYLLAATDVAEQMRRDYGGERAWGDLHVARFDHPIGGAGRPFAWLFSRGPIEMIGDGTTVMRTSYDRAQPFNVWELPSWRQIIDVGSWDEARVVLPGGQSGHPLSAHYFDQNEMWRQGQYRPQPFSRSAVDAARQHRLLLLP